MSNNKQNKVTEISESIFFGISHGKSTNEPTENDYVDQPLKNKTKIMSNNKQSSVDFLIKSFQGAYGDKVTNVVSDLIEQAKAMHKEEIRVAYMEGAFEKIRHLDGKEFMMPTDYYNETFGGNNDTI